MTQENLFEVAAPLCDLFGLDPFLHDIKFVNVEGEAFIHEMCHIVSLRRLGVNISIRSHYGAGGEEDLGASIEDAIRALTTKSKQDRNERETLAIELVLLEKSGVLDVRESPELLGEFLSAVWGGAIRNEDHNEFEHFVLDILKLRDDPDVRKDAKKVERRIKTWLSKLQ